MEVKICPIISVDTNLNSNRDCSIYAIAVNKLVYKLFV